MAEPFTITTEDGYTLSAHTFSPPPGEARGGVVVISGAFGVAQRFYRRFAAHLAGRGWTVLTYDYRGMGASRPRTMRGFDADFAIWGRRDLHAVLGHALALNAGPVVLVGHSSGGALPALTPHSPQLAAICTVCGNLGYVGDWAPKQRRRLWAFWNAVRVFARVWGYFPARRLGLFEDIPAGMVDEIIIRKRDPDLKRYFSDRGLTDQAPHVACPMLVVSASDDPLATPAAIERLHRRYRNAEQERRVLDPSALGLAKIGHFDVFHERLKPHVWDAVAGWLECVAGWLTHTG